MFLRYKLAVFCDGDFWHGRNLEERLEKLARGHNPSYWTKKIMRNVQRDRKNDEVLRSMGWKVLRFWETDLLLETNSVADQIEAFLNASRLPHYSMDGAHVASSTTRLSTR
jgi:DNA mismatch endonuclease (patch repair protein)